MYTSYMKNVPNLVAEANGRHCFLPLIANVIKSNIISSIMHIIVCLPKIE